MRAPVVERCRENDGSRRRSDSAAIARCSIGNASSDRNCSVSSQPFTASTSGSFGLSAMRAVDQRLDFGLHVFERRAIERQIVEQRFRPGRRAPARSCGSAATSARKYSTAFSCLRRCGGSAARGRADRARSASIFSGWRCAHSFGGFRRQLEVQRLGHRARHGVLDLEDVAHRQIEGLGPDVQPGLGRDELHGDAQLIARAPQAAFEHVRGAERAPRSCARRCSCP